MTIDFKHQHAAHCESGVISSLLRHQGVSISEAMAFGLSSALSFAYLPFIKMGGMPLIAYRMPPRFIIKGLAKPLNTQFVFETFRDPVQGKQRLDQLLAEGKVVGLQTSVYWLPYFPEDMRFHFNGHNLVVYGREGDDYLVSDPVFETTVRCPAADLQRARFAKGALAPKGLLYYPKTLGDTQVSADRVLGAIRRNCKIMLGPVPIVGIRGMRMLAKKIGKLPADAAETRAFVGHIIRMQEEIGTGGAGFRFVYAAFLQEAAQLTQRPALATLADKLIEIGDDWRAFALATARMVKGRDPFNPVKLADLLLKQAEVEKAFFSELQKAAR
ncbi:MAG TPA: BtrH N-terminal domain-containing protein [Cellvibrio sp.]|nr:BtrH N-terminal domain-containing protein [Cellvibrio sp.]